jgi:hypothetical protein
MYGDVPGGGIGLYQGTVPRVRMEELKKTT